MKESVTKVIDTLTQEDFHVAFQKLLERYECIAAGGDYFEGDESFKVCTIKKVPLQIKSGNLSYASRILQLNRGCSQRTLSLAKRLDDFLVDMLLFGE